MECCAEESEFDFFKDTFLRWLQHCSHWNDANRNVKWRKCYRHLDHYHLSYFSFLFGDELEEKRKVRHVMLIFFWRLSVMNEIHSISIPSSFPVISPLFATWNKVFARFLSSFITPCVEVQAIIYSSTLVCFSWRSFFRFRLVKVSVLFIHWKHTHTCIF